MNEVDTSCVKTGMNFVEQEVLAHQAHLHSKVNTVDTGDTVKSLFASGEKLEMSCK